MKENKKVLTNNFHKTGFRKIIRDERLHPRVRLLAQLFLAYLEGLFPVELLTSVIESEYGIRRIKTLPEETLEERVDRVASRDLLQQWNELIKEDNGRINNTAVTEDRSPEV